MKKWETMTAEKAFITDLGATTAADSEQFCRFAVWIPEQEKGKHRIAEVGNDLERLKNISFVWRCRDKGRAYTIEGGGINEQDQV